MNEEKELQYKVFLESLATAIDQQLNPEGKLIGFALVTFMQVSGEEQIVHLHTNVSQALCIEELRAIVGQSVRSKIVKPFKLELIK